MSFSPTSRYHSIQAATYESADGKLIRYLLRRFVPSPERFVVIQEHAVTEGDRLDNVTAHYLGDAEQFWRICDANAAMRPAELEEIGRRVHITLPEGIPGTPNA